ncbi:response regulator [Maribacter confluentis]|uniref:Response regulator n=1 Tax=Maribacter confluentis TaxID=1656093 RepID=A0ABT8RKX4_9FLAO|nr:response regulator [Maribacter confluentis]MDO1511593.1 response regulator [Maribacter confluentis]
MKNTKTRIIILERDSSMHIVYKNHFDALEDYELVGSYTSANLALKDFKHTRPQIVLSEIDLDDINGIDAIKLFRKKNWGINIIMFSEINDFEVIKKAFKKGPTDT